MPPRFIVDLDELDLDHVQADIDDIRAVNAQRYEMEQLTAIIKFDPDNGVIVARRDVSSDEFWVRGHIPGRPLLPGVLICECAAQLCSYYYCRVSESNRFIGFGGMERVKFRGQIVPGDCLIVMARSIELRSRRATFETQGVVHGRLVFEGVIIGMPM